MSVFRRVPGSFKTEVVQSMQEMKREMTAMKFWIKRLERSSRGLPAEDDNESEDNISNYVPCSSVKESQGLNMKLLTDTKFFEDAVCTVLKLHNIIMCISRVTFGYALPLFFVGSIHERLGRM